MSTSGQVRVELRGQPADSRAAHTVDDQLVARLREFRDDLASLGVGSLHVYGSRMRGEGRPDSDLDLFVDSSPGRKFSLFDLAGAKTALEEALRLDVDMTTRGGLHPLLRDAILASAVRVF